MSSKNALAKNSCHSVTSDSAQFAQVLHAASCVELSPLNTGTARHARLIVPDAHLKSVSRDVASLNRPTLLEVTSELHLLTRASKLGSAAARTTFELDTNIIFENLAIKLTWFYTGPPERKRLMRCTECQANRDILWLLHAEQVARRVHSSIACKSNVGGHHRTAGAWGSSGACH